MQLVGTRLRKSFGARVVLAEVDLVVEQGVFTVLVGPSGLGKSTLLGVMGGALRADSGTVEVRQDGLPISRRVQNYIAWVPQGANALTSRNVLDNATLGALSAGHTHDVARKIALDTLSLLGLETLSASIAGDLSGGELQRLAFARALSSGRPFLLADEPTGNLDEVNTANVVAVLRRVSQAGAGLLVATHDSAVAACADVTLDMRTL